ncbi:hypothetical protein ZEAMMB73_Zm00001d015586 [Zea mays]|uniref:Uncharacterized protein n=1 Tax=Zea mays TaxID=4577 RepID=A0A1D6H2T5_MAIZE|nr:hypothetical protein ZEAMMB73_Zm00001d015586 [Zea mays]
MDSGSDSDGAPEELTAVQGVAKHEETSKVEKDSVLRVTREGKERRKRWAQRRTSSKPDKKAPKEVEDEDTKKTWTSWVIWSSSHIIRQTFASDSEEENVKQKVQRRKKRMKTDGPETILLKDVRSTQHVKNALDFLEHRKNRVPRSNAVLKNASKALRLLSSKGNFLS